MQAEKMRGLKVGEFFRMPVRPYPGGIRIYRLRYPGDQTGVFLLEDQTIASACQRRPEIYRERIARARDGYGLLEIWTEPKTEGRK